MNNRLVMAITIFLLIIGIVFLLRTGTFSGDDDYENIQNTQETTQNSVNSQATITLSELEAHNSENDCWIAFERKVYDVTSWIPKHPGGPDKIIPYCGSSEAFENAFTTQHGRSKVNLLMQVSTFIGDFDFVGTI